MPSFVILDQHSNTVAFDLRTGAQISFDLSKITCILDIYSNAGTTMEGLGLPKFDKDGTFSTWVSLEPNQAVAVTGLASCGAVFIANGDFTRVAAGHIGGNASFVADWCEELQRIDRGIKPSYVLLGTGPAGSPDTSGILRQYVECFHISADCARDVVSCSKILLARSQSGVVYASRSGDISFRRAGQAVRGDFTLPDTKSPEVEYFKTLAIYDSGKLDAQMTLIQALGKRLDYRPKIPFGFSEDAQEALRPLQEALLSLHGKEIAQQYLARLPAYWQDRFLQFKIFQKHPDWKP
jgi:hypothetical protein